MTNHNKRTTSLAISLGLTFGAGIGISLGTVFGAAFGYPKVGLLWGPAVGSLCGLLIAIMFSINSVK